MPKAVVKLPIPEPQIMLAAKDLGLFVKAARTQDRLTLREAAALCGVTPGTIQKIEHGSGDVKLSTILAVCNALGVELRIRFEPKEAPDA